MHHLSPNGILAYPKRIFERCFIHFFLKKKVTKKIKANLPHVRDSAGFAIARAQVAEVLIAGHFSIAVFSLPVLPPSFINFSCLRLL